MAKDDPLDVFALPFEQVFDFAGVFGVRHRSPTNSLVILGFWGIFVVAFTRAKWVKFQWCGEVE